MSMLDRGWVENITLEYIWLFINRNIWQAPTKRSRHLIKVAHPVIEAARTFHWGLEKMFQLLFLFLFCFLRFYLFNFRERVREGKKHWYVRETSIGCLLHTPNWGPGPQPRRVPREGIKLVTFWFAGWCPAHWATPVRALFVLFLISFWTYNVQNMLVAVQVYNS